LARLQRRFAELNAPFTLLEEIDLQHSHPNLYAVTKLNAESTYLSAIICFLPPMLSTPKEKLSEAAAKPELATSLSPEQRNS
jgi:hypothetical protein